MCTLRQLISDLYLNSYKDRLLLTNLKYEAD